MFREAAFSGTSLAGPRCSLCNPCLPPASPGVAARWHCSMAMSTPHQHLQAPCKPGCRDARSPVDGAFRSDSLHAGGAKTKALYRVCDRGHTAGLTFSSIFTLLDAQMKFATLAYECIF